MVKKLSRTVGRIENCEERDPEGLEQLDFDGWEYEEDEDGNCTYDPDD